MAIGSPQSLWRVVKKILVLFAADA